MKMSAVVACDLLMGIGKDNKLPWEKLKSDMARFRSITMGHPVIMGRKTWESIGRPLPGRTCIVLSGKDHESLRLPSEVKHAVDIRHACQIAKEHGEEAMVIGGGEVYEQMLPLCHRVYLTVVHLVHGCDTFFSLGKEISAHRIQHVPRYRRALDWKIVSEEEAEDPSGTKLTFVEMARIS